MVQRVPGHLGEESRFSPWLVVAAVAVTVLVGVLLLFFAQFPAIGSAGANPTATPRARTPITRIITATPANTPTSTVAPTITFVKYTVKQGDTLSTIARQFRVSVEAIRAANNLTGDTIHAGDTLNIPQGQPPPTPTPRAMAEASGAAPGTPTTPTNTPIVFVTPTLIAFAPSPNPATPTTPTPTPGVVPYMVRAGDTLLGIATVYSTTVKAIMDMNKLTGPDIRAGEVLTVPVGAWAPTLTPTVYVPPTVTPTPQFSYAAPDLLYPSDGADFAHNTSITLQWLSPGALQGSEYYVVHLRYLANGVEQDLPGYVVSEGTSLTLDGPPASTGSSGPTQIWWYVVVVRGDGCGSPSPAAVQPCAVSPISETRSFTWR